MTSEIAARLNQVGILTYADLAAQSITRISELLGIESTVTGSTIAEWLTIARPLPPVHRWSGYSDTRNQRIYRRQKGYL